MVVLADEARGRGESRGRNGQSRPRSVEDGRRFDSADATTAGPTQEVPRRLAASRPRPGFVKLFPVADEDPPAAWRVSGTTALGRSRDAGLRLDDDRISRRHAVLEPDARGIVVRDCESKHGSVVQGRSIAGEAALAPFGSVVRFGRTLLLVVDDIETYRVPRRRISAERLGLAREVTAGPLLASVWDQAARAARLKEPVLVLGESGSGKECAARIVHASRETPGPFVGINIAAVPDGLFEAELFGHERGAFTGAVAARRGAFREAGGGVLFLDEIGDLRAELQAKLLRALDLGNVRPLGANRDVNVDVRVVSSTSLNLQEACNLGAFRRDLWFRLSSIVLRVPPLRERPDDVIHLALDVLQEQAAPVRLSCEAAEILALARWTGNVRQLRYAITYALDAVLARGDAELRPEHLPSFDWASGEQEALDEAQIRAAVAKAGGVVSRACGVLGVSRTTFYNALKRLNLDPTSLRR